MMHRLIPSAGAGARAARPSARALAQHPTSVFLHTRPTRPIALSFAATPLRSSTPQATTLSMATASTTTRFFHASCTAQDSDHGHDASTVTQKPAERPCYRCATPLPYMALICTNSECNAVQSIAPGTNYYEVLGMSPEPTFDLDVKSLRNRFLRIQQQIHPDSFSHNTDGNQVYAQQQSSLANKAYSTLKEPLSRANYMLHLLGSPVHETESLNKQELLMEVMEARELLEDAQTEEEVDDLKAVNDGRIQDAVKGLTAAFKEQDLETAKTLAIELQYWIRIQNVIRDWAAGKPIVADHV